MVVSTPLGKRGKTPLNIIIPIKQVPETSGVRMDEETGTVIREGVDAVINPLDLYAVEEGIRLKEARGGHITVITMGPPSAETSLREALAMGCDNGILLSGREFAGSDTWATSYALVGAIKKIREYHLILTGERATDGDTGQVGPGIASFLDIPLSTYTSKILEVNQEQIMVERLIETGYEVLSLQIPALLTVVKEINSPRLPTLKGKQRARKSSIPIWDAEALGLESLQLGRLGSPTQVVKIEKPKIAREGTLLQAKDLEQIDQAVAKLALFLQEKGSLGEGKTNGR